MSKMDDMRAMREANYEASRAAKPAATAGRSRPAAKAAAKAPVRTGPTADLAASPDEELCGHRAISGRTCTRDKGHAAKSHRYS